MAAASPWRLPVAKQGWTFEAFYADQWNAVASRTSAPFTMSRGLRNELGTLTPQTASFVLDGRNDPWNPYDPASALYDQVGRNFPIRIGHEPGNTTGAMADASDDFSGSSSSGWPDADVGGAWSLFGAGGSILASDWTEGSGAGSVGVTAAPAYRGAYLGTLTDIEDATIAETWTAPLATGGDLEPSDIMFRGTSTSSYMHARVSVTTANAVTLAVFSANGTTLGTATTGLTHAGAGTPLRTKVRYAGRDVWVKVWDPAGAEPGWDLHVVDTTTAPITGWIGIRSGRGSGNTNTTTPQFTHDDFSVVVNNPRFVGEVASLQPRQTPGWDGTSGDRWTEVEAAGVMRRITVPDTTLRGTLYRYLSRSSDVVAYWALEESDGAATVAEAVANGRPGEIMGSPSFGTASGILTGADTVVQLASGDSISMSVPRKTTSGWQVAWALQIPTAPGSDLDYLQIHSTGTAKVWVLRAGAAGMATEAYDEDGASVDSTATTYGTGAEPPQWLYMRLNVVQNSGNVDWDLVWNIVGTDTFYWTTVQSFAGSAGRPVGIRIGGTFTFNIGHVLVSNSNAVSYGLLALLATGYAGELVEDRMTRLLGEEGVVFDYVGTADDTPAMSGQEPGKLVDLFAQGVRADQGVASEPHGWLGFRFRGLRNLYNQTAALTVDAASGTDIAAGTLVPLVDDLPTENDITARRPGGSEARAVLESGRMSVQDPPTGAGRTATQYDVALYADGDLGPWAYMRLHFGTINEARFGRITVDLDANPSLADAATLVRVGDIIAVDNLGNLGTVRLLVLGIDESGGSHRRMISFNCMPGSAFNIIELDDNAYGLLDSDGSTLSSAFVAGTDTSMSVAVATGYPLWTTGSVAFDVNVGGDVVAVSSISGASSPQTFTVSATLVSGVAKTVAAGSSVTLAAPNYLGR